MTKERFICPKCWKTGRKRKDGTIPMHRIPRAMRSQHAHLGGHQLDMAALLGEIERLQRDDPAMNAHECPDCERKETQELTADLTRQIERLQRALDNELALAVSLARVAEERAVEIARLTREAEDRSQYVSHLEARLRAAGIEL